MRNVKTHLFYFIVVWLTWLVVPAGVCSAQIADPFGGNSFGGGNPFGGADVVIEYEAEMAQGTATTVSASETTATGEAGAADKPDPAEAKRKKERLAEISKLVFDRRPSAILKLWAEPEEDQSEEKQESVSPTAPSTGPVEPNAEPSAGEATADLSEEELKAKAEAEAKAAEAKAKAELAAKEKKLFTETLKSMTRSVTLGQWESFGQLLSDRDRLDEKEAVAAYERMIAQLGSKAALDFTQVVGLSAEMQKFMQSMMNNQRNNPARAFAEKHVFDFADIVAIIRAAPVTLEDKHLKQLASLLRLTLQAGDQLEDFLAAARDDANELLPKQKVALLLSAAARDDATAEFLPSLSDAKEASNVQALNLLARHFMFRYKEEKVESLREQAWEITLAALDVEKKAEDKEARAESLSRAVSLAPQLRDELGRQWLKESFTKHPDRGQGILAKLGTATAQRLAQMPQDSIGRQRNLELQAAAVEAFFATDPKLDAQWTEILNLLASNWLQEADVSRQHSNASRYGPSMQRDSYGNIYYGRPTAQASTSGPVMALRRVNPVEVDKVLETAPSDRWLETIDENIRPQYTMMHCRLWLKINEETKAFPFIELLASTHPETARELSEEFLRVWTSNHNPNEASQRTNYYMFQYGYDRKADKIPLTRSKQQRNLEELSQWVARLRELPLEGELDEQLLVRAFMTCHSVAEVFDVADIEEVFGAWGSIEAGTMASLAQQMRTNLAGLWRDPNVQRDAKTNRKKQDIQAEVVRGYDVAKSVLRRALDQYSGDWQLLLAKACVMHDENDFLQEVAPSSAFSERRQAALDVFSDAAQAYVKTSYDLPEPEQRNDVFDYWFYASLGATDLRGISEKNRPVSSQIDRILETMNSMTGEVGVQHRERFANALFTRMSAVSPACKFRYLEAGFKLVGEDPQAEEARKVYNYYKDLVTELELVARIDGDSQVGHTEPFGVYIDLKHTKELERESGGFAKYLQNQNGRFYSYNYGRPTENYRDKFQDAATVALQDKFEVLSITFNHPETKSRAVEKSGWRVTPYAHLLLKARGPEVDKVPALKLDLDFLDTSGYVVLPISSSPIPIDSSTGRAASSVSKVNLVQLLDERQAGKGTLIVEANVSARGLIPPVDEILDTDIDGFSLAESEDSGVGIVEFDKESIEPVVLSERTWTLKYQAKDAASIAPSSFTFPSPIIDSEKASFQRYVDADLEEVDQHVVLVEAYGSNQRAWTIGILCGFAGLLAISGLIFAVRKNSRTRSVEAVDRQETPLTPFSVLALLKEVEGVASLPSEQGQRLSEDITAVESYYFAAGNGKPHPDLERIAARWGQVGLV